jgi:Flp pilus assembly protein TadD
MNPSNLDGLFVLGTVLLRSGNQEGRDHLRRFQRLSDVREHRELAYDFYRRGRDPDRAAAEFEKALVIEPQDAATLTGLGTVRLAQGNAAAAIELLAQAREAGAASVEWYREWVLALHAAERSDEAAQIWQQVREAGVTLGPRVWAALGNHQGAC